MFDRNTEPLLPSKDITTLLVDRGGKLWIGTRAGVVVFDDHIESLQGEDGLGHAYVGALGQGAGNRVWVGTENGLLVIDSGHLTSVAASNRLR